MKRVFKIDEIVWYIEDYESGWGKVGLINRSDMYPDYPCSDESGDILTIIKEGCTSEIECSPSNVYQIAPGKFFHGEKCVYEHDEEIDYPLYCPAEDVNCYYCELDSK